MFESSEIPDYRFLDQTSEPDGHRTIYHDRLGDLRRADAFTMPDRTRSEFHYRETRPLYIHLSVTGRCQARCQGCINTAFSKAADNGDAAARAAFPDTDPVRDARCIANLIRKSPDRAATICLYGGEPLLAPDTIRQLMENIAAAGLQSHVRYMLYTNGGLLEKCIQTHPEMMRAVWLYSVSIDGTASQHEHFRRGTHLGRIHAGLAALKDVRQGVVLMWSTLREEQSLLDCFNEFTFLHDRGLVDQFFWHWVESRESFANLARYAAGYERDLHQIMKSYTAKLKDGTLLPITHINELVLYLLCGRKRKATACGVELAGNYDIVGGRIHSCADLPPQYAIGTVAADGMPDIKPHDLTWLTRYKTGLGCSRCGVHNYCGGRCPVQAVTGSAVRLRQYCQLMRLHVSTVNDYMDEIAAALEKHAITPQQIYDRSAQYVQFTDGTP